MDGGGAAVKRAKGFAPATVALIIDREQGRCARCGRHVTNGTRGIDYSIHHRRGRGMGGDRSPEANSAAAGVLLCGSGTTGCHGWIESHRSEAMDTGWLVSRNGRDLPTDIPFLHYLHGYGRALDNGLFERSGP